MPELFYRASIIYFAAYAAIVSQMFFPGFILAQTRLFGTDSLAVKFDGKYGQVEVGGAYAGAEFHHSRPLPSRISFYYPVANSIDLSTSYWKRDESEPFKLLVNVDGRTDTVGTEPCEYSWTPYQARFVDRRPDYRIDIAYHFCDSIPFMVFEMTFTNEAKVSKAVRITSLLSTTLRTCQTYAWKDTAEVRYSDDGSVYTANFRYLDTDSATVLVVNAGSMTPSDRVVESTWKETVNPVARFDYSEKIPPSGKATIVQLIGSCKIPEASKMVVNARRRWKKDIINTERRISDYVYQDAVLRVPDKTLEQTAHWSKAELAADKHYIDGSVVPMPCPAEYNFFFTHDVLLTDLGAVFYDLQRVKQNLLFIRSLTRPDSILPHAYYWRDNGFKTEFAAPDNWNHLWFMILCGTYLKHSDDRATIRLMYPILKKSVEMTLSNVGPGGLAYSIRPDWWDIGDNNGARSYLTALMVRALREYCYVALSLDRDREFASSCLSISDKLEKNLSNKLWNSKSGYLLNTMENGATDYHYYAGSLVAVDYDVLDKDKADSLMLTARKHLLDTNLGVRTAMPADFDTLTALYRFKSGEAGGTYTYLNGAVWTQTTAWYILGLIQLNHVDEAKMALQKYLSINGIEHSPNGQPSFYEYRYSDPSSPLYGKIDKPNFMWAGGWYLNTLYHLIGVRENEWNISLVPDVPSGFDSMDYDLTLAGKLFRVTWKGSGKYFKGIFIDGKPSNSAVLSRGGRSIIVERGTPASPYLESATCVVKQVTYSTRNDGMEIDVKGFQGQTSLLTLVSPFHVKRVRLGNRDVTSRISSASKGGVYTVTLPFRFEKQNERAYFKF